ncbi:Erd2 [Kluyveromyces lactis]|nr:Erd2 [Kluyveromyces lactis]
MKIVFISSSVYVIVLMRQQKFKNPVAYQDMITRDQFRIKFLVVPCILLGLIFNYRFSFIQICWSFSLWLESVAILPQLFMLTKTGKAKQLTSHYIFALGLYRALYIPNWIWRYYSEERFDKLSVFTGVIQTLVYSDFFYIYYQKVIKLGGDLELPH